MKGGAAQDGLVMRRTLQVAVTLGCGWLVAGTAYGETLGDGWQWRRSLAFKQAVSDAPGENAAWAEFYANGAQQSDGADIRVTTADRQLVPLKVMQVSRNDDLIRIAFATRGDGPYYAWWGNAKAEKPLGAGKELEIRRGIYMEVMRNEARPVLAIEGTGSGPVLASFFVPEISMGFSPFGDDRNVLLHYSGQFRIDRAIQAQMAFTTSDTGALQVDGKEMVRERGGLRGRVRDPFPVDLAAGWHTLNVRELNQGPSNVAVAVVWQRPGEAAFSPVPASIFAPVARATAGPLEKVNAPFTVDFTIEPTAEGFIPPSSYVPRYTFDAQFPSSMRPTVTWDFGDGQVVTGLRHVSHVFLLPGVYAVTLKVETGAGGGEMTTTARIAVKDRMYARFPRPPEDPAKATAAVLKDYDPRTLGGEQALQGMLFFESVGDADNMETWGKAWLNAREATPLSGVQEALLKDETWALARSLVARRRDKEAAECFRLASLKPAQLETRARMMRLYVVTLCDYVDDAPAALKEAQEWVKKAGGGRVQSLAEGAVAYAAVALGDGKMARAAVEAALASGGGGGGRGGGGAGGVAALNQKDIRQGVLARNVENYIRTKEFDTAWELLNQWEEEFPDALWDGFTRTLRVKVAAAEGRNLMAAHLALAHAKANPEGFYAAELLYRAQENLRLAGEQAQARTVMEMLRSKYPESPYARGGAGG